MNQSPATPLPNVSQDQKDLYRNIQAAEQRLGNGRYAPATPREKQTLPQDKYAQRGPESSR
jgi:hypothetical protein